MTGTEHDPLEDSAGRVADGAAVDWQAELEASPGHRAGLAGLERVAQVAEAWRRLGVTPEDDEAPAPGGPVLFRWGAYEVLEKLGEGSFGEVFRAFDPSLGREVALKLRRDPAADASARRVLEEARRLARVRHRNVLAVYGAETHHGRTGLITELVRGRTLERELAERGPLGAEEAALVGADLCTALAAVHAAGFVHGDVKPANVMREAGGRIVLMDFGSGSAHGEAAGVLTGTPLMAAPEVLRGAAPDARADLYSLGALLFRLVAGRHAVTAATLEELQDRHERGERESLRSLRPDLSPEFIAALERALDADPAKRWSDAGHFETALRASMVAAAASSPPRAAAWQPWALAAVLVVVAVALWRMNTAPPAKPSVGPASVAAGAEPQAGPAREEPAPSGAMTLPPAAPPVAAVSAEAVLYRLRGGERTALTDGASIAPGDHLFLEVQSAERLHVYVLDEDEQGETYALFPVPGTEQGNPLPAGERHRLPGRRGGQPFDWVVTSSGGRDHVLVIAAREPLPELERRVAQTTPADADRAVNYARIEPEALALMRGIGGMSPAPAGAARESALEGLARALAARRDAGLWLRSYSLLNR